MQTLDLVSGCWQVNPGSGACREVAFSLKTGLFQYELGCATLSLCSISLFQSTWMKSQCLAGICPMSCSCYSSSLFPPGQAEPKSVLASRVPAMSRGWRNCVGIVLAFCCSYSTFLTVRSWASPCPDTETLLMPHRNQGCGPGNVCQKLFNTEHKYRGDRKHLPQQHSVVSDSW